jgi:uncharacterized protein
MSVRPRVFAVICVGAVLVASCSRKSDDTGSSGTSSGGVDAGAFDKSALLRTFGECAYAGYGEFQLAAVELQSATTKASTEATPAALDAARAAWIKAIDAWQRVEVFGFGPAAMTGTPGGKDLRDPIYAWPLVSRCLTEQQIVEQTYSKPAFATALITTRGLAVAEYLLFYAPTDNACAATVTINSSGAWAALGDAEIKKRKLAYAQAIGADTVVRGQQLLDAWDPAKGNFVGELTKAGQGGTTFATQQLAFNAVNGALFYADDELKDMKVGKPAGLVPGCTTTPPCLGDVESPWAKRSKDHLRNNLAGIEKLIRGCGANGDGLGFDDLLRAIGAENVAKNLETQLAAVRAALDALEEPTFEDDLVKNPAGVKRLFDALRAFATVLKTEFITVLDLELPKRVEGDND